MIDAEPIGNLPTRLRGRAAFCAERKEVKTPELLREAADEIERLRNEVAQLQRIVSMSRLSTDVPLASRAFPSPFKL